ncbi:hypothetical protein TNCV_3114901 [Trichonephila clavipes]|nr:hypothetical protein TNCV_3114901 [Trichonephila clavipes]
MTVIARQSRDKRMGQWAALALRTARHGRLLLQLSSYLSPERLLDILRTKKWSCLLLRRRLIAISRRFLLQEHRRDK